MIGDYNAFKMLSILANALYASQDECGSKVKEIHICRGYAHIEMEIEDEIYVIEIRKKPDEDLEILSERWAGGVLPGDARTELYPLCEDTKGNSLHMDRSSK
jgi:hypothetical protein